MLRALFSPSPFLPCLVSTVFPALLLYQLLGLVQKELKSQGGRKGGGSYVEWKVANFLIGGEEGKKKKIKMFLKTQQKNNGKKKLKVFTSLTMTKLLCRRQSSLRRGGASWSTPKTLPLCGRRGREWLRGNPTEQSKPGRLKGWEPPEAGGLPLKTLAGGGEGRRLRETSSRAGPERFIAFPLEASSSGASAAGGGPRGAEHGG